jgi:radical SAM modification target selenobiotic family peptide
MFHNHSSMEAIMKKDMKKILAGLGVASLIGAGGMAIPTAHAASSG